MLVAIIAGVLIVAAVALLVHKVRSLTVEDVMVAYAKDAVDAGRRGFQKNLDYSIESIEVIEEIARKQHDAMAAGDVPTEEQLTTFAKIWGAYLGEVIRKKHGG